MSIRQRPWNVVALALATVVLNAGAAASQLITDGEPFEACEVRRFGEGLDVPEWLAFVRTPGPYAGM